MVHGVYYAYLLIIIIKTVNYYVLYFILGHFYLLHNILSKVVIEWLMVKTHKDEKY